MFGNRQRKTLNQSLDISDKMLARSGSGRALSSRKPHLPGTKFGTYEFVGTVMNNFIHFLHHKRPGISNKEFGDSASALLEGMHRV